MTRTACFRGETTAVVGARNLKCYFSANELRGQRDRVTCACLFLGHRLNFEKVFSGIYVEAVEMAEKLGEDESILRRAGPITTTCRFRRITTGLQSASLLGLFACVAQGHIYWQCRANGGNC